MKKTVRKAAHVPYLFLPVVTTKEGDAVEKSPELEAIDKVAANLETFKEKLGEKADKEQFESLENTIKELKDGLETLTGKQVTEKMETINTGLEKAFKQILDLQEELAQQKDTPNNGNPSTAKGLVTREQVKEFIDAIFDEDGKKTHNQHSIALKAAETFGIPQTFVSGADTSAFTGRVIDPTLYQRRRKSNLILDTFEIPTIDAPKLIYLVKVEIGPVSGDDGGDPGGAAWIDSGEAKPKRSFRVDTEEVEAKKVAIFATIEDKLLRDVASFETWIREDFMQEMREEINNGLLNNNPGTNPKAPLGLKTNAVQYAATPAYDELVENPNYIDDIIAAIAFQRYHKEVPMVIWISSDVWYRIHHLKATDGKWLNNNLVYVNSAGELFIAGIPVKATDEEDVPSTHLLAIAADAFKIRAYGNMVIERGLNGEDFREDKTSFRGYQEFLSYIPEHLEYGVLYDTFANIEAAIAVPVGV